jgi:hypothetical protein
MSACPPHFLSRCVARAAGQAKAGSAYSEHRVITAVEPLASLAGAAAFLLAFLFAVPSSPRRRTLRSRVFVKEPIEKQAKRHFQT